MDSINNPTEEDVKRLAKAGEKMLAIDIYRRIHNVGLAQALDAVEKLAGLPPSMRETLRSNLPLSPETQRRLEILFSEEDRPEATRLLIEECGTNLSGHEKCGEEGMERIRFAVLKLSGGELVGLTQAIREAKGDWRDVLCGAGFGNDVQAHKRWLPVRQYL